MSPLRAVAWRIMSRGLPRVTEQAWQERIRGARVLAEDRIGCRTMLTADGAHVVKELGLRRVLSSGVLRPYALRFAANASELLRRGVAAPEVVAVFRRDPERRHVVVYRFRQGRELLAALREADSRERDALLERFGAFVARLHEGGIDARALHFGNVLCGGDGSFALVDVVDVRFEPRPLRARARARALGYASLHSDEESAILADGGMQAVLRGYLGAARLREPERVEMLLFLPHDMGHASLTT